MTGLFDVVVQTPMLNSVINLRYWDLVLVTINALCAKDGVVFTNTRSLESAAPGAGSNKSAAEGP